MLYPKYSSNFFPASSVVYFLNCESEELSNIDFTSCSQEKTRSECLRMLPLQSLSSSRTRSKSIPICALLRQHVQPISSTENALSSL